MIAAVSGISIPSFWLGMMLIDLFSVRLGWLPTGGYGTWRHFVLPAFTLGSAVAAVMARTFVPMKSAPLSRRQGK
jgi:glutathione transport system permease protein